MKVTSVSSLFAVICSLMVVIGWNVAEAQAQQRGRGMGGGMGGGMGVTRLLGIEQVQKEIKVTEEQKAKLEKMREGSRQPRQSREERQKQREEIQKLSQEERQKRMESMMKERREQFEKRTQETMKKLAEILKPEQLMRVKQIQMQMEGVAALRRPEVMKHIGLDDAQKAQLQKINEGALEQMRELFRSGRNRDGDDANRDQSRRQMREKMQNARKDIEKKVMGVLKPEQKKKLGEMMGKPFELDRSVFGRRGDGRRGEGRQGNRGQGRRGGQNSSDKN